MSSDNTPRDNNNETSSGDTIVVKQFVTPPLRRRINQPTGFHGNKPSLFLRGTNHDYLYYPLEWKDKETGKTFKKGYYDENGDYYESVVIQKDKHYETTVACSFCGTEIRLSWEEGELPSCPNCGASLHDTFDKALFENEIEDIPDTVRIPVSDPNKDKAGKKSSPKDKDFTPIFRETDHSNPLIERIKPDLGIILPIIALVGIIIAVIAIDSFVNEGKENNLSSSQQYGQAAGSSLNGQAVVSSPTPTPLPEYYYKFVPADGLKDKIYVKTLGRFCYLGEDNHYYDPDTGCSFWCDTDQALPTWVYRFDGISTEFGNYGVMKYDYEEGRWLIEASMDNWIHIPDKYDESTLWHMPKPGNGKYKGKSSVYVSEIGRTCEFIEDEHNYYDPETKCHFYYDEFSAENYWVYWFEDFREKEGIGWLRYDKKEDVWYTQNEDRWFKISKSTYDFSKYCWHMTDNPI